MAQRQPEESTTGHHPSEPERPCCLGSWLGTRSQRRWKIPVLCHCRQDLWWRAGACWGFRHRQLGCLQWRRTEDLGLVNPFPDEERLTLEAPNCISICIAIE